MFPRPLIRMFLHMVSAAHVFGTVSITTERKLPPKKLNINRRHMVYENPPGKNWNRLTLHTCTHLYSGVSTKPRKLLLVGQWKVIYCTHYSFPSVLKWLSRQFGEHPRCMFWKSLHRGEEPTAPCKTSVCSHKALWDICNSTCTYFLFDELRCLVVDDGLQVVFVCCSLRVQAEVECNEDGRQLIPEVLLILHSNREENRAGVWKKGQKAGRNDSLNSLLHFWHLLPHLSYLSSLLTLILYWEMEN